MGALEYHHIDQLFHDGATPKVEKSHCFLCHRPMLVLKKVMGNACWHCNDRTSKVARYIIDEQESDLMLLRIKQDLDVEEWEIDGVGYYKYPNGTLTKISNA